MTADDRRARPRAFRLDPQGQVAEAAMAQPVSKPPQIEIELQPDPYELKPVALPVDEAVVEMAQRRGMLGWFRLGWGGLFWSALGGLVSLGIGLWIDGLIEQLFSRAAGLGWIAVALAALVVLALLALTIREVIGVFRQAHVAKLHAALAAAHLADDTDAARRLVGELAALYAQRSSTAAARAEITRTTGEIVDGRDLLDITERLLLHPIDAAVAREIAEAAKRVSLVTAISPRAILDLVFVVGQIIRLIRRVAELYSGRPGFLGFVKLARSVGAHLAVTGGMAIGDSLLQQVVGHGIAAKLSARLGEGVLNGLLTTRVGLSAMAVCRPMPFAAGPQPGVKDVAPFLFGASQDS
ncbi:TIGR01620 family protein [Lichenihabitans sp. Uapishka_5]|uniref:YcjF family protein n=1 Tax=Lichenihabitans sp. Uapishka_5 TaxID=3037302 RepID=UPI0029E82020|nr:TIGR01620 family protein [Lichenihabitans sp. Uapishka_5]MDX7949686.1 TIGR01620 family protein [Lichenihabitans sp. Uapishka_5]